MTCTWKVSYVQCENTKDKAFLENVSEEIRQSAESMATELLNRWTGRAYGLCSYVVRPTKDTQDCEKYSPGALDFTSRTLARSRTPWTPALIGGKWYNLTCSSCRGSSATADLHAWQGVSLPRPLHEVTAVWVNGEKLESGQYVVIEGVVYPAGDTVFPENQDLSGNYHTDTNTFAIEFTHGTTPPMAGQIAAGVLSLEIMRSLCKDTGCKLPERLQSITRQGVTMGFVDTFEGLEDGKTGLWLVDSWVSSLRGAKRPSAVHSPDGSNNPRKRYQF